VRPLDRVLERLENVRQQNGYFVATCPAHQDRDPSLSVKEGDDGRVLINCFAGCAFDDVVAAIDLETKDLFDNGERGRGFNPTRNTATPPRQTA
jgi:DNA primase